MQITSSNHKRFTKIFRFLIITIVMFLRMTSIVYAADLEIQSPASGSAYPVGGYVNVTVRLDCENPSRPTVECDGEAVEPLDEESYPGTTYYNYKIYLSSAAAFPLVASHTCSTHSESQEIMIKAIQVGAITVEPAEEFDAEWLASISVGGFVSVAAQPLPVNSSVTELWEAGWNSSGGDATEDITRRVVSKSFDSGTYWVIFSCGISKWAVVKIIDVNLTATGCPENGKDKHYLNISAAGYASVTASVTPSISASAIKWEGDTGEAGGSVFERKFPPCSAPTSVPIFKIGSSVYSGSLVVHMIQASAPPPAAADAPKTYSEKLPQIVMSNGDNAPIGVFENRPDWEGVTQPTYTNDSYFASDRWVFRLRGIGHEYRMGFTNKGYLINLPDGSVEPFPRYKVNNQEQGDGASKERARYDLDPTKPTAAIAAIWGPPRYNYYVEWITKEHEHKHKSQFYEDYWRGKMDVFEQQFVEIDSVYVIFNCDIVSTTSGDSAQGYYSSTWNDKIEYYHNAAVLEWWDTREETAHAVTNPYYITIRDSIP